MSPGSAGLATYGLRQPKPLSVDRRVAPSGLIRCACRRCGSHVHAVVLKQTISGSCSTCGSYDIALLNR